MQLVVSPIVVCSPHLRSPLFTTHRKQEAVCNPLKLEYARLSLTGTVGEGISKASLDGVRSIVLRSFFFLPYFCIIFSFDFYISNLFLAIATRTPFHLPLLSCHIFLRACLFISTLERKARKKSEGMGVDDFTVTCAHASIRQQQGGRAPFPLLVWSILFFSLLALVFFSWIQLLYVLHWASVTKRRNWLAFPFRERRRR